MRKVDIKRIIDCLDEEIEKRNILTPVEANKILERKGLLKDSKSRPGLPLRNLLRDNLIPHAYQPTGKNGRWKIPHSCEGTK